MTLNFTGKVALVTGGTSGIGLATALALVDAGASVVISGRDPQRGAAALAQLRRLSGDADFVQGDVSHAADVERMVASTIARFGGLHCAVNNAAAFDGVFKRVADLTEAEFDSHLANNLRSVWLCMKHEIPHLVAAGGGAIVNVASVNGFGGTPLSAPYAASKAAVLSLTKSAALECAAQKVRVNAVAPGAFLTPMLEGVMEKLSPGNPGAAEARYQELTPLGRIGQPEEAARAIVWLCSEEASYVTGSVMTVDGGMTAPFR